MIPVENLLIEIGTEELPPSHLGKLSAAFANDIASSLSELGIAFEKVEHFAAPRRIAARLSTVPLVQPARAIQRKGPNLQAAFDAKGAPTQAALGFARSCGVDFSEIKTHESPQGSWLIYEHTEAGKPLTTLLPAIIEKALNNIPAKKRMRWGNTDTPFLRPIHWITALHGATPLEMMLYNIKTSNITYGHRVMHPEAIALSHADDYLEALRKAKVIANHRERQEIITRAIHETAEKNKGIAVIEEDLLDQVSGLVEWPVTLSAHFDADFLEVPSEALISSMQNHQKCFAIKMPNGKLLPTFILVSNIQPDNTENIIRGNERVMCARLQDAKFFYENDRKTPLVSRLENLKHMTFQKKLGSLYDKSLRIAKLAGHIGKQIGAQHRLCEQAGKLCKADLLTEMVYEFPELQGIMGTYYALNDGEPQEVAIALQESYLPRFAKDALPASITGICVALADRLDTLIGIFGIGQLPTGDKDPYALRRQAVAILRILIEKALPLDLEDLCKLARYGYGNVIEEEVIPTVVQFCFDRLKAWYQEQGVSPQTIEAVMAKGLTQPFDISRRLIAVSHFQTLPEAPILASANKRVKNILQKNDMDMMTTELPKIDSALLQEEAESVLANAVEILRRETEPLIQQGQYQEALTLLAQLQQPVDNFFDNVMVMTDDLPLRQNRMHLLSHLHALFMQIADISKLVL